MYMTNIIEGLNRQFRQITKNKPSFTNDDSLLRMLYMASQRITRLWRIRCQNWDLVLSQLELTFASRDGWLTRAPASCLHYFPSAILDFAEFRLHNLLRHAPG